MLLHAVTERVVIEPIPAGKIHAGRTERDIRIEWKDKLDASRSAPKCQVAEGLSGSLGAAVVTHKGAGIETRGVECHGAALSSSSYGGSQRRVTN